METPERGYRARGMDEKWDVFVENHVAFLHRSWTGNGVFEATFSPAGEAGGSQPRSPNPVLSGHARSPRS